MRGAVTAGFIVDETSNDDAVYLVLTANDYGATVDAVVCVL
jgi:hypothetical protein